MNEEDRLDAAIRKFQKSRQPKKHYIQHSTFDDCQAIADLTAERLGIKGKIKLEVKDIRGAGHGCPGKKKVIVPLWAVNKSYTYRVYYIVHEVCHVAVRGSGEGWHSSEFKETEREALSWWDIEIEYARAYPKKLWHKGRLVYSKK